MRALGSKSLSLLLMFVLVCAAPTPQAKPASNAPPLTRPAPTPTATPDPAATALAIVPLTIREAVLPPAEPTPLGFAAGRPTPTPFATAEAAWKYVTISFALENRSAAPRLVNIGGGDPSTTNLANATLAAGDGKRYKPMRTSASIGTRTATSHALTSYPVLLRLPPGFRVLGESDGSLSVVTPEPMSVTFKVPSGLSDYGTLGIPPLANLSSKPAEDDVTRVLRPLLGGIQPAPLSGVTPGPLTFPVANPAEIGQPVGTPVSVAGNVTTTLVGVVASDPDDYEVRNRGWKQITLSLQYRNDDSSQTRAFSVAGWLFGEDGVVYTGDAPTIGDFGRALTPPDPASVMLWDGRSLGSDPTPPGQALEPRKATFLVPKGLTHAVLVLAGDVEAMFDVGAIPLPPSAT